MSTEVEFKKLFEPGRIGRMQVRNRIVMPAMATGFGSEDGFVTQQLKDYYEARARGGAGLVIVEFTCVDFPRGKALRGQLAADDDQYIPGLKQLAGVIQKHGAGAALQLHHAGHAARQAVTHEVPVGASPIARPGGEVPRELTIAEIREIVSKFADAAGRAQAAGFDGVEIHAAHSYLLAQFLSSAWNQRQDRYGGTLENRARFLLEVLGAVREAAGKAYPVWCRINGEESDVRHGTTLDEAKDVSRMVAAAGADAVNVSAGAYELTSSRPYFFRPGWAAHLAAGVKEVVDIPVMAVGRIGFELAEKLLQEKKADFIVMGRALRADPDLPNKLASGRLEDIRPCIACNDCGEIFRPGGQRICSLNPALGREGEYRIKPAVHRKSVLVAGGGPAGLEAARVAALRGHEVLLYERGSRLGGQLLLAAIPPFKAEIEKFIQYFERQIEKLGIRVELNQEVTPVLIRNLAPDAVVLATGARPLRPDIGGSSRENVFSTWQVLSGAAKVGQRVAVIGGGAVGCEVAHLLAEKGKSVIIVEMLEKIATDIGPRQGRRILLDMLAEKGVTIFTGVKAEAITDTGVVVGTGDGNKKKLPADTVVLACGSNPDTELIEKLEGTEIEVHLAGDCVKPRRIFEAVEEGARIGRTL